MVTRSNASSHRPHSTSTFTNNARATPPATTAAPPTLAPEDQHAASQQASLRLLVHDVRSDDLIKLPAGSAENVCKHVGQRWDAAPTTALAGSQRCLKQEDGRTHWLALWMRTFALQIRFEQTCLVLRCIKGTNSNTLIASCAVLPDHSLSRVCIATQRP